MSLPFVWRARSVRLGWPVHFIGGQELQILFTNRSVNLVSIENLLEQIDLLKKPIALVFGLLTLFVVYLNVDPI